jgi:hypothetical protein
VFRGIIEGFISANDAELSDLDLQVIASAISMDTMMDELARLLFKMFDTVTDVIVFG